MSGLTLATASGVSASHAVAGPPSAGVLGAFARPVTWPLMPGHLTLLPNGKVLSWGKPDAGTIADVWDPVTDTHTSVAEIPFNLFCSGHSLLPDGKVFIPGGTGAGYDGIIQTHIFDPDTMTFRRGPDMNAARWYPGALTLGSGDVLIVGGHSSERLENFDTLPQVYEPSTDGLRNLNGANRPFGEATVDQPGGTDYLVAYYPRMHLTPNGTVYVAQDHNKQSWLDTSGDGSWTDRTASVPVLQLYNNSVLFQPDKALVVGGGWPGSITSSAEVVDIITGEVTPTDPMTSSRKWQNSVLLPTGDVLTVGGEAQAGTFPDMPGDPDHPAVMYAESWNPATGHWTRRGDYTIQRFYHSTALLLPDGRVLSAGGGQGGPFADQLNAEIYTPWYLYKQDGSGELAARPTITDVANSVFYGSSIEITTPDAASIARVTLVRLGATTHAQDENQRFLELPITTLANGAVTVAFGTNPNAMPPGHYMLSIVDNDGVPSVSTIVKIGAAVDPPPAPSTTDVDPPKVF